MLDNIYKVISGKNNNLFEINIQNEFLLYYKYSERMRN